MCGIAGIVYADHQRRVDHRTLQAMAELMTHRGPDAEGFHIEPGVGLASRRLRIIDLDGGNQPIANEDGRLQVVLNGEIYNFQSLRRELEQRGHSFRTRTDTEVIVHAYEEWGTESVKRLNGMFAFALWDARSKVLFLARDRIGKKPLFYSWTREQFVFASELKALLQSRAAQRDVDPTDLELYLTFGAVPPPRTIFRGVFQVPPAHYAIFRRGELTLHEYWDVLTPGVHGIRSEGEALEEFRSLLDDCVRLRLISDVPIGAFLSGGIDSSTVVERIADEVPGRVLTVTVAFREKAYSEAGHARDVARVLRTDHHEVLVEPLSADMFAKLVWHLDEPMADSSAMPTYLLCQAARQYVTVALSGDGGDELFAGYEGRYRLEGMEARVRHWLPWWIRHGVAAPLARLYPKREWIPRFLRLKYFLENLSVSLPEAYVLDRSVFRPDERAALLNSDMRLHLRTRGSLQVVAPYFDRVSGLDPLSQILYVDLKTDMVNTILTKVDRMSMANSLEVRCPLLDYRMVEFAARMPIDLKMRSTTTKYLLRRHLNGRFPPALVARPKQGFSIPLAQWLRQGWSPIMHELLLSPRSLARGYWNPSRVRQLIALHLRGARDYSTHLWALMIFEQWHRLFIDQAPGPRMETDAGALAHQGT